MIEILVVDGYNVINGWPELKSLARENLEHARVKLLDILANYQGITDWQTVVIFDAHSVKGQYERRETYQGIQVIYSREGETADSVIERFVYLHQKDRIFVATSDGDEQRIIFGSGAYRLPVRQFREDVFEAEKKMKAGKASSAMRTLEGRIPEKIRSIMEEWRRAK